MYAFMGHKQWDLQRSLEHGWIGAHGGLDDCCCCCSCIISTRARSCLQRSMACFSTGRTISRCSSAAFGFPGKAMINDFPRIPHVGRPTMANRVMSKDPAVMACSMAGILRSSSGVMAYTTIKTAMCERKGCVGCGLSCLWCDISW